VILPEGRFGEPSVRRLSDGTWAMSYLNCVTGCIVTRTAAGPDQAWSGEKTQLTSWQEPSRTAASSTHGPPAPRATCT
jgi:hypothetical protein